MENRAYSVFDVKKEVVYEGLDEVVSVWAGQCAEANCEEPDVEVRDGEPALKGSGKVTLWFMVSKGVRLSKMQRGRVKLSA